MCYSGWCEYEDSYTGECCKPRHEKCPWDDPEPVDNEGIGERESGWGNDCYEGADYEDE